MNSKSGKMGLKNKIENIVKVSSFVKEGDPKGGGF
jgi:hypothetical protein